MKEKAYYEKVNITNAVRLREQLELLPKFCKEYFIGIEQTTSSRTRLAYAYDLGIFFEYIHDNNPVYRKIAITEYPLSLLDEVTALDIEEYLSYLKYYIKNGVEHTNDERGIARKLASLRSLYNYFYKKELIEKKPFGAGIYAKDP